MVFWGGVIVCQGLKLNQSDLIEGIADGVALRKLDIQVTAFSG